jgi:hypothetical protein
MGIITTRIARWRLCPVWRSKQERNAQTGFKDKPADATTASGLFAA